MIFNVIVQKVLKGLVSYLLLLLFWLLMVRPLVLSKTLSQIWDRLNLLMLLFKVGLLTLI